MTASESETADDAGLDDSDVSPSRIVSLATVRGFPPRYWVGIGAVAMLAALPTLVVGPMLVTLTYAMFFGMFAMSWDLVSGYTGEISFGHALFFATGGYTSALLNIELGVGLLPSILVAVVVAAVAGLIIGGPALRLEGPYFSLVTLVAPLILLQLFIYFSEYTGGVQGLGASGVPKFFNFGIEGVDFLGMTPIQEYWFVNYYVAFALFVVIFAGLFLLTRSTTGSILTGIREDEEAVAALGFNPAKYKIFAFGLSGVVGGLAGAVFVHTPAGTTSPSTLLVLAVSIEVIIASVLGGMGTISGAAFGGFFFYLLRNQLSAVEYTIPVLGLGVGANYLLIFALITLVLLFVMPGGLIRWGVVLGGKALARVRGDPTTTDGGRRPTDPVAQTIENYRTAIENWRDRRDR